MKVQGLIFACCIGLMFVLIMALTIDEKPLVEVIDAGIGETSMVAQGHGFVHPDFETMHRGGSGKERHDHTYSCSAGFLEHSLRRCLSHSSPLELAEMIRSGRFGFL